jgi:hypothetical protein
MVVTNEITIRTAKVSDIESIKQFFIEAYGERTIFQNELFLLHYFDTLEKNRTPLSVCLIGISPKGEIVSHYGGLYYNLKFNNSICTMIWGVSAYTLPEWRGRGVNSKFIDYITQNNEINGVIGFSQDTASFYQKIGYNLFNFNKLSRYVLILDCEKTLQVISFIKQNTNRFDKLVQFQTKKKFSYDFSSLVELTEKNIYSYELNMDDDFATIATTHRSREFLIWRFFENPFIKYTVYGFIKNGKIIAYIAMREEELEPLNFKVNRIIDIYGKKEGVKTLLHKSFIESLSKKHIYIDFSMFGTIYNKELLSANFLKLENEDCSMLPQVTSPIENRQNREFIGIQSKFHSGAIENLYRDNVYFTRMDSDRDRLASISQIVKNRQ